MDWGDDGVSGFGLVAFGIISALRSQGLPAIIAPLGGRRTEEQQRRLVEQGLSQTLYSKHVEGRAIDIDFYGFNRDDVPESFWLALGPWVEANFSLSWGGRWAGFRDLAHFESRNAYGAGGRGELRLRRSH